MKGLFALLLVGVLLGAAGRPQPVIGAESAWQQVASGIEYEEFHMDGPIVAYVARMDRANPSVILDSALANGRLTKERETVPAMAERMDGAINFWNPEGGERNRVVVAINGSYIDTISGLILSGQIESGWYVKNFDDGGGESGFVWKSDRSAFIGGCVLHQPQRQILSFPATGNSIRLNGINELRRDNSLVLFTPQYSANTGTAPNGLEVVVEMTQPAGIYPAPHMAHGFVREMRDGSGSTPIPFDSVVLSAEGKARDLLLDNIQVGDEIGISQEVTSLDSDCRDPVDLSWTKAYAGIGGAFAYLRNGEIYQMDDLGAINKHPRTAIAFNDQYIYFIVVDGRIPEYSVGMTFDELAVFSRDTLGATWGMAQDGGGSSTMVVNGVVRNQPVSVCPDQNNLYLPVIRNVSLTSSQSGNPYYSYDSTIFRCLRPVGNAMMMIVSEPARYSNAYKPFDLVTAKLYADLFQGPGTNYPVLADLHEGQAGLVLHHLGGLDGVFAKGSYWWKVVFNDQTGWVKEQAIDSVRHPLTNIPLEP